MRFWRRCWLGVGRGQTERQPRWIGSEPRPGVSLLKPLYGDEPFLLRNLASFCAQDYAGPVEVLFGVGRADDAAVAWWTGCGPIFRPST